VNVHTFTPGPWLLEKHGNDFWVLGSAPEDRECGRIALIEDDSTADPTDGIAANARLIASAPTLLKACRQLVALYSDVAPYGQSLVVSQARAAIEKATGGGTIERTAEDRARFSRDMARIAKAKESRP